MRRTTTRDKKQARDLVGIILYATCPFLLSVIFFGCRLLLSHMLLYTISLPSPFVPIHPHSAGYVPAYLSIPFLLSQGSPIGLGCDEMADVWLGRRKSWWLDNGNVPITLRLCVCAYIYKKGEPCVCLYAHYFIILLQSQTHLAQ